MTVLLVAAAACPGQQSVGPSQDAACTLATAPLVTSAERQAAIALANEALPRLPDEPDQRFVRVKSETFLLRGALDPRGGATDEDIRAAQARLANACGVGGP